MFDFKDFFKKDLILSVTFSHFENLTLQLKTRSMLTHKFTLEINYGKNKTSAVSL